ncbi:helix-turn-helix transcriptional regulator [Agrobacterium vaccinii]|jgi:transcriptional regulator with XRE-family HTH domain|nr:helix-turn-helix transcriptional regulator [Agrobacterium vaccinii]
MTKSPPAIDAHLGARIRMRRSTVGMTQGMLGDRLGITLQQIQKYEKGTNRAGAGRLQRISELLSVPISFFFEGDPKTSMDQGSLAPTLRPLELDSKERMALVKAFLEIDDASIRQRVLDLIQSLGGLKEDRVLPDAEPLAARSGAE